MNALFKKMNHKNQSVLHVVNAPASFEKEMREMESLATIKTSLTGARTLEFFLGFVTTQKQLDTLIEKVTAIMAPDGLLWFAYPKGTSKKYTCEFNRDTGWAALGAAGYEGVRQVAIDEDWSALRFRRAENIKTMTRSFAMSDVGKKKTKPKA